MVVSAKQAGALSVTPTTPTVPRLKGTRATVDGIHLEDEQTTKHRTMMVAALALVAGGERHSHSRRNDFDPRYPAPIALTDVDGIH